VAALLHFIYAATIRQNGIAVFYPGREKKGTVHLMKRERVRQRESRSRRIEFDFGIFRRTPVRRFGPIAVNKLAG
jgi:hypothetical protein